MLETLGINAKLTIIDLVGSGTERDAQIPDGRFLSFYLENLARAFQDIHLYIYIYISHKFTKLICPLLLWP
jgi:hypothetical protein